MWPNSVALQRVYLQQVGGSSQGLSTSVIGKWCFVIAESDKFAADIAQFLLSISLAWRLALEGGTSENRFWNGVVLLPVGLDSAGNDAASLAEKLGKNRLRLVAAGATSNGFSETGLLLVDRAGFWSRILSLVWVICVFWNMNE